MRDKEIRMGAAILCAVAVAGAALTVHAECGNNGPSGNDAETACHDCATGAWRTGSCTWHEAEAGDTYCGVCLADYNCTAVGTHLAQKVTTYTNGTCSGTGCFGGDAQTDANATPKQNAANSCRG
jgi:hypothetical protein